MSVVLGINAVFHDPSAALVVDGHIVAAAEEERFNRRKHGKACVPFSTWELPEHAIRWCLDDAGIEPEDVDAVAYSYDPSRCGGRLGDLATRRLYLHPFRRTSLGLSLAEAMHLGMPVVALV